MIIRTEEEFLANVGIGDTFWWSQLYLDEPTDLEEFTISQITSHDVYVPHQKGLFGEDLTIVVQVKDRGENYPRTMGEHTIPRYWEYYNYLNTILMKDRVCATTKSEAEQSLAFLKWLNLNDPDERERVVRAREDHEWDMKMMDSYYDEGDY